MISQIFMPNHKKMITWGTLLEQLQMISHRFREIEIKVDQRNDNGKWKYLIRIINNKLMLELELWDWSLQPLYGTTNSTHCPCYMLIVSTSEIMNAGQVDEFLHRLRMQLSQALP